MAKGSSVFVCHWSENIQMNFDSLSSVDLDLVIRFEKSYRSFSLEHIHLFFSSPLVSVSNAPFISTAFKQVAFVTSLFHHSFNDIKCFIYFSVLRSQNKTAAAPHLGTGDCCEEKRSNAAESILKRGTLTGRKKKDKKKQR